MVVVTDRVREHNVPNGCPQTNETADTTYSFDEEGVAFYFFILTLVGFYVIPTTFRLVWKKSVSEHEKEPVSTTAESKEKSDLIKRTTTTKTSTKVSSIAMLVILWAVFGWALYRAWQAKINFKPYDPFEILGVPSSAAEDEIKSAFKKLSRLHHPDKAKAEDRDKAEGRFVEISKAYKALTDERTRKNWEEYGNPDGIRTFALGVALPSWLVNSSNRIILLVLYCVAFGIGLPLLVKKWWGRSKIYTKSGLRHASMGMFFRELKENTTLKKLLEILANASEFLDDLPRRPEDEGALKQLHEVIDSSYSEVFEVPKKVSHPLAVKAYTLLFCHLHRIPVNDASLRQDQLFVISKATQLIQGILQISMARQWLSPTLNGMNLSQFLVQGMWESQSPILQLPHITKDIARHCASGKKSIHTISDLLDMKEADRRSLLRSLNDESYQELLKIAQTFPVVRIQTVSFKMLGQEHITPGGLITCQVRLALEYPQVLSKAADVVDETSDRDKTSLSTEEEVQTFEFDEDGNLIEDPAKKGSLDATQLKPIYCPRFPHVKRPYWWVSLVNRNHTNIVAAPIKVTDLVESKTVMLQLPAPPKPMPVSLLLVIKSDAVVGVDIVREVKFTVVAAPENSPVERWDISGEDDDDAAVTFAEE